MKNRMVKEISEQQSKADGKKPIGLLIREELEANNFEGAIGLAKKMTDSYFNDDLASDL